jgi:hypothetical protein
MKKELSGIEALPLLSLLHERERERESERVDQKRVENSTILLSL